MQFLHFLQKGSQPVVVVVGLGKSSVSGKFLQKKSGPKNRSKSIFSMPTHVGSLEISAGGNGVAPDAAENVSVLAHFGQYSCAWHASGASFWMTSGPS
jgi:hypothetical protein